MTTKTTTTPPSADQLVQHALHQFIGYGHAKKGYGLIDLVAAMGLDADEWKEIKGEASAWLSEDDCREIEKLLGGSK